MQRTLKITVPGVAFTAALLHDIGKLLLSRYIDSSILSRIRDMTASGKLTYLEAERSVLGVDHAQVGSAIAKHWTFPEELVRAIEQHHHLSPKLNPVLDAVFLANLVAKLIGVGLGSEQMNLDVSAYARRSGRITRNGLEILCVKAKNELDLAEVLFRSY